MPDRALEERLRSLREEPSGEVRSRVLAACDLDMASRRSPVRPRLRWAVAFAACVASLLIMDLAESHRHAQRVAALLDGRVGQGASRSAPAPTSVALGVRSRLLAALLAEPDIP